MASKRRDSLIRDLCKKVLSMGAVNFLTKSDFREAENEHTKTREVFVMNFLQSPIAIPSMYVWYGYV